MVTEGLRVDRDEALRYLGYDGQKLDADLARRFDEAVVACERLRPRCLHAAFPVDHAASDAGHVALAGHRSQIRWLLFSTI